MADATANLKLGLVDDGFVAGISNASTQITNLQLASTAVGTALPLLEKALKSNASQYVVGAKNAGLLAKNLRNVIEVNKELGNVIGKASNITFYAQQFAILAKGASDAYSTLRRIPETLEQMERSGVSTGSIQGFMTLRDAIQGNQAAVESFAQVAVSKLNEVEQASARVGTILKSSTNFSEQGIAKRANAEDLNKNRRQLQGLLRDRLGNTVTTTEALLGQYEVLSGGFTSSTASQQVLDPGLKLIGIAKAGGQGADPTATLQLLTKTLRAYGLEASQATRVSAILNATVENGITTIQELSMTFGQASQVAKTAGISIEDLAAATSVLTAQGTSTPVALTGIQALSRSIIDKTPEAAKELAKLRDAEGNRIRFDIREVQQKGLVKAVQDLFQATGGNQELLAQILPDSLAYRTALGLYSNKGQDFANVSASVKENANAQSLDEVFKTATDDRISRFEKIANRFEETIIQVGESLAPIFEPGIAYLEKISKLIANIPDPIKKAIGAYLAFQIQAKTAGVAFGQLAGAVVSVLSNFALLRVITLVITGQFGKQVAIVKDLILQKKGLGTVVKQLIGLDQSHLLLTKQTTEAIAKEGVVQKAANAVREKVNDITRKNVKGFVEQTEAVKKSGVAVSGAKGKFAEFIETIRNTSIGKKIDEITGKFSTQQEAVGDLAKKTKDYFNSFKSLPDNIPSVSDIPQSKSRTELRQQAARRGFGNLNRTRELFEAGETAGQASKKINLLQASLDGAGKGFQLLGAGAKQGLGFIASLAKDAIVALGPIVPIGLAIGAAFALAGKEINHLFGGGNANQLSKGINSTLEKLKELEKETGKDGALLALKGDIATLSESKNNSADGLKPLESRLAQLRSEGSLTEGQFTAMSKAFKKAGEDGKVTAQELSVLQNQVQAFRSGAPGEVEKGFIDTVKGFFSLENLGKGVDYIGNQLAAVPVTLLNPFNGIATAESVGQNREADKLLEPLSKMRILLDDVGDSSVLSAEKTKKLTQGIFLTQEARELAAKGSQIQGIALEKENKETDNQIRNNEALIAGYQEQAESRKKTLDDTKDPALKQQLQDQFDAAQAQVNELQRRSEALKQAREQIIKYYNETLPVLQQTVIRSAVNPAEAQGALDDALTTFKSKYLDEGKNFLKDVQQQRTEGQAVLDQVLQNYDRNLLSTADAGAKIKEVLDQSYITVKKDGKDIKGSIFDIDTQKNLINQISQFQSQATTERIAQIEIESSTIVASGQLRQASEEDVTKRTTELQKERLTLQRDQLVEEIKLRMQYGIKVVDLENKLKQTTVEIAQLEFNEREKLIQKQLEQRVQAIEVQRSEIGALTAERGLSEEEAQKKIAQLQIDESTLRANELKRQLDQYAANGVRNIALENQYAQARNQIREAEAKEQERLTQEQLRQKTQAFEIEKNQFQILAEEGKLGQEDLAEELSKLSIDQAKLKEDDLVRQVDQLKASGQSSVSLEQELSQQRLQIRSIEAREKKRIREQELEQDIAVLEQEKGNFDVLAVEGRLSSENLQKESSRIAIAQAKLREDDLKKQIDVLGESGKTSVALENQYAQQRLQIRNLEAQERKRLIEEQLQQQIKALDIEQSEIELRISERTLSEREGQSQLAQNRIEQERLRLSDLERQSQLLQSNGQESIALEQEIASARIRIRKAEADERNRIEELQFETLKKQLENEQQRSSIRQQALEIEFDLLQKQSQLTESIRDSRNQLADAESRFVQSQLQNQAKLTRDPLKQAEIELRILSEREADLGRTQKVELESLANRQKLAVIDLQRQQIQIQTQQIELQSQAQILGIELQRAQLQRRSPEEIEAIRLQLQANQQRTASLNQQLGLTQQQISQQNEITSNEQKRIRLNQQTEAENLKIERTLIRQKVLQEQIDRITKDFTLAQQKLQQEYEKQASTLENQSTILGFQKQLIEARLKAFNDSLSLTSSELDLASRLANSDRERNALAQTTATIKLKALAEQQKAEREVLLINQEQAKVQQQIEAIRLKSQQSQNLADQAQAQADLAKIQATPGATPQEILAAQLNIQAKQQAGQALAVQSSLLPLQQQLLDFTQQQEISNLDRKQRLDRANAQADVSSNLGLVERTKLNQQIQTDLLSNLFGQNINPKNSGDFLKSLIAGNRVDLQQMGVGNGASFPASSLSSGLIPNIESPTLVLPNLTDIKAPNIELGFPNAPTIGQEPQGTVTQPQSVNNNVTLELGGITINSSNPGDTGKGLEQEVLNAFDRIMIETKRRLG